MTGGAAPISGEHSLRDVSAALALRLGAEYVAADYPESVPMPLRNYWRALRAVDALRTYSSVDGSQAAYEPAEQYARDLLTDMAHLCQIFAEEEYAFTVLVARARSMHAEEQSE
jgi:hypothetical protein